MLSDHTPMAVLAVADLARARAYYEGTLGFAAPREAGDGVLYAAGGASFLVYQSGYAGTNKATAVTFSVPDGVFDDEAAALRAAGVEFQTFDVPEGEWQDGVLVGWGMRAAWFTDPDGNILNIETEQPA